MKRKKLDALSSILAAAQSNSSGEMGSAVTKHRADLIERYYGEKYGDELEDRSDYVDTTVRDTVESIKPELMDIFFGGDRVVEFAPNGDEDVEAAEQETEVCNHVVSQMNDGYTVFLNWFHDALAFKNGYVKRYWEERLAAEVEEYGDLNEDERIAVVMQAMERGEVEILEIERDEETGRSRMKIQVTPKAAHVYRIENVPPEEVIVHPQWTRIDFKGCPFVAHKRTMTVSDLVEMGFDRKQAEALPTYANELDNEEKAKRHDTERSGDADLQDGTTEPSMREVLVYENYIRHDMDGDGIAELLQVYTGDQGEILKREGKPAIEQVDAAPFNVLTPFPIPHKHFGLSAAELVEDMQRVKTVLTRQLIDNEVGSNNPDIVVDSEAATAETVVDLEQTGLGRVIRAPGGQAAVSYLHPPNLIGQTLQALEYISQEKEQRTGVTRLNQGLDADALNKTFGGMKAMMNTAQKRLLLIARTFAETGVKSLFMDIHRDLRKGPLRTIASRLRGQFVEVSPRTWADRSDMTVNVGLGTGDRDVQFQRLALVLEQQKEALGAGMVEPKNIHHTLSKMLELSGFKDVASYFPDPALQPPKEPEAPPPDPALILAQVEMKKVEQRAEESAAELSVKLQIAREEIASRERIAIAKIEKDATELEVDQALKGLEREALAS